MKKLRKLHVLIIGVLVSIIVAVGMYFVVIKPAIKTRDDNKAQLESNIASGGTDENVRIQKEDVVKAEQEVASEQLALEKYMKEKMPNISLQDRATGMLALWQEQSETLGPLLVSWIKRSGVRLASQITIPAPPANPNAITYDEVTPIRIDLGRIRVEGSYQQILKHLRKWNQCNRLVMIDLPALSGESPNLACEYNLTVFLFPRTPSGDLLDMAGGGDAGAGMGGMPGMPMMPGAAPSMPGTPAMPGAGAPRALGAPTMSSS